MLITSHLAKHSTDKIVRGCEKSDMPQFRGGNPYFLNENLYQSVSFTNASMYRRHFARDSNRDAVCKKIPILHNQIKITILLLS